MYFRCYIIINNININYLVCKNVIISLMIGLTLYYYCFNGRSKTFTERFENDDSDNDLDDNEEINIIKIKI